MVTKKRIGIITALTVATVLVGCGPKTEATPMTMEPQSNEAEQTGLKVVSVEAIEGFDEQDHNLIRDIEDGTDVTKQIEGYEDSSFAGKLSLTCKVLSEESLCYEISEDGETVFTTPEYSNDHYVSQYFQMKDIDGDGVEELLGADWSISTISFQVGNVYVFKNADGQWSIYGRMKDLLKDCPEYEGAILLDAALTEDGIRVVSDKGEKKEDGVFYPEEYEIIIR